MAGKAKYLMIATMDVDTEHEAIFNEVYDKEHVPNLRKVPGVIGVTRYKRGTLKMNIGGETQDYRDTQRAGLYGDLRTGKPRRSNQSGLGQSHRRRPLAQSSKTLHEKPPPCSVKIHGLDDVVVLVYRAAPPAKIFSSRRADRLRLQAFNMAFEEWK